MIEALVMIGSLLVAALIHELGHYCVLKAYNVRMYGFSIFGFNYAPNGNPDKLKTLERHLGIGIIRDKGSKIAELLSCLAGPLVNLLVAIGMMKIGSRYPWLAFPCTANIAVGIYNLLPLPGTDGLRFLKTLYNDI